jgi:uroporphyrinogen-III synthase
MTASLIRATTPRLWITRPKRDAEAFATEIEAIGYLTLQAALLEVMPMTANLQYFDLTQYDGFIITSLNALRSVDVAQKALSSLPLWVVGTRLALEAKQRGYTHVMFGGIDVQALTQTLIQQADSSHKLLYLSPKEPSDDIASTLNQRGYRVDTCIVYRTEPVTTLTDNTLQLLRTGMIAGVTLLSFKTAQCYIELIRHYQLEALARTITHFCLSDTIAKALNGLVGTDKICISAQPNRQSMLAMIEEFQFT